MTTHIKIVLTRNLYFSLPGQSFYFNLALVDRVLPAAGRDHPAHVARRPVARKIRPFHNDIRHVQVSTD